MQQKIQKSKIDEGKKQKAYNIVSFLLFGGWENKERLTIENVLLRQETFHDFGKSWGMKDSQKLKEKLIPEYNVP